jgi:hypothetical protein
MNKGFESIVDEIKFLRWSLMPAHCENLDEDEKSVEDYAKYYASSLDRSIESARRYLTAIEALASASSSDEAILADVFSARSEFAAFFPFCIDELLNVSADELKPYFDFMGITYRSDAAAGGIQKNIAQYIELLEQICRKPGSE